MRAFKKSKPLGLMQFDLNSSTYVNHNMGFEMRPKSVANKTLGNQLSIFHWTCNSFLYLLPRVPNPLQNQHSPLPFPTTTKLYQIEDSELLQQQQREKDRNGWHCCVVNLQWADLATSELSQCSHSQC